MTSISNMTSKLCLITPGVCVCGGATYFALNTFFIHVTVKTDQNEHMLWPNRVFARCISKISNLLISPHCYIDLIQFLSQNQTKYSHIKDH